MRKQDALKKALSDSWQRADVIPLPVTGDDIARGMCRLAISLHYERRCSAGYGWPGPWRAFGSMGAWPGGQWWAARRRYECKAGGRLLPQGNRARGAAHRPAST